MNKQLSIVDELVKLEKPFEKQNEFGLKFETECLFAKQQIIKNDFTVSTAQNNPNSLRSAILNVAAIGISLNPASAHAYLVPRDGQICLDVSYRGLVKLATDTGAIVLAKAVLVYEGDTFESNGPFDLPTHKYNAFDQDRIDANDPLKNLLGGYCAAKLTDGTYMVELMTSGEIIAVRDSSKAKNGPWKGKWAGEMAKKTLVKRAYKSWPQSNERERLDHAVNVINQHEGLEESRSTKVSDFLQHSQEQKQQFEALLNGDPIDYFLWWKGLDDRIKISLVNSFESGQKGKGRELANNIETTGRDLFMDMLSELSDACMKEDDIGAREVLEDLPPTHQNALIEALPPALTLYATSFIEAA